MPVVVPWGPFSGAFPSRVLAECGELWALRLGASAWGLSVNRFAVLLGSERLAVEPFISSSLPPP